MGRYRLSEAHVAIEVVYVLQDFHWVRGPLPWSNEHQNAPFFDLAKSTPHPFYFLIIYTKFTCYFNTFDTVHMRLSYFSSNVVGYGKYESLMETLGFHLTR
jgi:hypothetical protein